ncbi:MAG: hypothetical protein GY856_51060 [bacterium]|nr:hypothetical protein [bacterium]
MPTDPWELAERDADLLEGLGTELLYQADPGTDAEERWAWVGRLTELGFLGIGEAADVSDWIENGGPPPAALCRALAEFRYEAPVAVGGAGEELRGGAVDPAAHLLDPIDLAVLARFTSFDGELTGLAQGLPAEGHTNLYSRSLHYRLQALGFCHRPIGAPLGPETWEALARLARSVPEATDRTRACELLCDFAELLESAVKVRGSLPVVYTTVGDLSPDERRMDTRLRTSGGWYDFRRNALARTQAVDWHGSAGNRFILHVLKILLWTYGFSGQIGDAATARSWRADDANGLYEAIRYHDVTLHTGRVVARVGRANGRHLFAVDVAELVKAVIAPFRQPEEENRTVEEVFQLVTIGDDAAEPERESDGRSFLQRVKDAVKNHLRTAAGFAKRLYHGVRHAVRSAIHAVTSFARDGPRKLWDFIRERAGPAVNVVRTWLTRIREGARVFFRALKRLVHFVLRRPIVDTDPKTGNAVITCFDLDADTIRIVEQGTSAAVIEAHAQRCLDLARGSRLLLVIAVKVLKTIPALVAGVGWLRFAFKVGSIVRDIVDDWDLLRRLATGPANA